MVVCADPEVCGCLCCCVLGCFVFFLIGNSYGLIQKKYGLIQKNIKIAPKYRLRGVIV